MVGTDSGLSDCKLDCMLDTLWLSAARVRRTCLPGLGALLSPIQWRILLSIAHLGSATARAQSKACTRVPSQTVPLTAARGLYHTCHSH